MVKAKICYSKLYVIKINSEETCTGTADNAWVPVLAVMGGHDRTYMHGDPCFR